MQKDEQLYHRLFAEIFLFLEQNPTITFQSLLNSPQVRRFYLDELIEKENSIN